MFLTLLVFVWIGVPIIINNDIADEWPIAIGPVATSSGVNVVSRLV
jgi:hypothetical protein